MTVDGTLWTSSGGSLGNDTCFLGNFEKAMSKALGNIELEYMGVDAVDAFRHGDDCAWNETEAESADTTHRQLAASGASSDSSGVGSAVTCATHPLPSNIKQFDIEITVLGARSEIADEQVVLNSFPSTVESAVDQVYASYCTAHLRDRGYKLLKVT